MNFSDFLHNNPLTEAVDTTDDVEMAMNSIVFNFFGYIALVKLNSNSTYLKTYTRADKPVTNINAITSDNNSVLSSIKAAVDANAIKRATATKMTKILLEIRQKQIDSTTLDENVIRSLLDEIKYTTYKPSPRVLMLLKDFHGGVVSMSLFAKRLFILAKQKDFMDSTSEFRDLVTKGQFIKFFTSTSDAELTSHTSILTTGTKTENIDSGEQTETPKVESFFFSKSNKHKN
jgi:hypothetical protein